MKIKIEDKGKGYSADLSKPLDISIPLHHGIENPNAFWAPPVDFSAVRTDLFTGSVKEGGLVNFYNVRLNPHGNGTHTECVGHIAPELFSINQSLQQFFAMAYLTSVYPANIDGDRIIMKDQLSIPQNIDAEALIIRTFPNSPDKKTRNYSGTNPPYLYFEAAEYIKGLGIKHLLLDLPSVDREEDEGKLLAHKAFWDYPSAPRMDATITEMAFIPDHIKDGLYLLELQVPAFELDAAPSRPVLYAIY